MTRTEKIIRKALLDRDLTVLDLIEKIKCKQSYVYDVIKGRAGTPSYMAPEMIRSWTHTELTDIYSFGVVMYELITGRKPFRGKWKEERMTRSLNLNPLTPSQLGRYCSPELEELLLGCLEKDPSKRIQSAREIDNTLFLLRLKRGLT